MYKHWGNQHPSLLWGFMKNMSDSTTEEYTVEFSFKPDNSFSLFLKFPQHWLSFQDEHNHSGRSISCLLWFTQTRQRNPSYSKKNIFFSFLKSPGNFICLALISLTCVTWLSCSNNYDQKTRTCCWLDWFMSHSSLSDPEIDSALPNAHELGVKKIKIIFSQNKIRTLICEAEIVVGSKN